MNSLELNELEMAYSLLRISLFLLFISFSIGRIFLLYTFYKVTDTPNPKFAFVPILPIYIIPIYDMIGRSRLNIIMWIIPIINIYFIFRDLGEYYKVIGSRPGVVMTMSILLPGTIYLHMMYVISSRVNGEKAKSFRPVRKKQKIEEADVFEETPDIFERSKNYSEENVNLINETVSYDLKRDGERIYNPEDEEKRYMEIENEREKQFKKENFLKEVFFDEAYNEYFVSKWLKSNLEVYIQNGYDYRKCHFGLIRRNLLNNNIQVEDIMEYVSKKGINNRDCVSIYDMNGDDGKKKAILTLYFSIFKDLAEITIDEEEEPKHITRIVEAAIELIKIENTVDRREIYEMIFSEQSLKSLSLILGVNKDNLENILKGLLAAE